MLSPTLESFAGPFSTSPTSPPPDSTSPPDDPPYDPAAHAHLSTAEQARLAAEEDKRRRNTAASARFRIKKKQRDQALERQAKETAERVGELEKKITQLELENRWLRNLLVEKNEKGAEGTSGVRTTMGRGGAAVEGLLSLHRRV